MAVLGEGGGKRERRKRMMTKTKSGTLSRDDDTNKNKNRGGVLGKVVGELWDEARTKTTSLLPTRRTKLGSSGVR